MGNHRSKPTAKEAVAFKTAAEQRRKETFDDHWRLEMQGKRLTLKHVSYRTYNPEQQKRGIITCFSPKARARRLRRIAEVDWLAAGEGAFVTVTYPDDQSDHTMNERKTHRFLLNRYICRCAGRPLGCFWRVEWMPRQTGKCVGQLRPHIHFIYLGHHNIGQENVRVFWEKIIGANEYTQVDVQSMSIGDMVACYASKYTAKVSDSSYLDNVPKRNRSGRHAGELRKDLIPSHPESVVERVCDAMVRMLRRRASETLWWYDPRFDEGFTILGNDALEIIKESEEMALDAFRKRS